MSRHCRTERWPVFAAITVALWVIGATASLHASILNAGPLQLQEAELLSADEDIVSDEPGSAAGDVLPTPPLWEFQENPVDSLLGAEMPNSATTTGTPGTSAASGGSVCILTVKLGIGGDEPVARYAEAADVVSPKWIAFSLLRPPRV